MLTYCSFCKPSAINGSFPGGGVSWVVFGESSDAGISCNNKSMKSLMEISLIFRYVYAFQR
jgi:hypothetical protein